MAPRLVALGGHEFRARSDELAIVEHLLRLTGKERPRVCLLPTASGDPQEGIQRFYTTLDRFDCEASHVSLFRLERERVDLREHLLSQDLVYVAGGSMLNLIAIWRAHGLFSVMRAAWERGVLIAGQSAGAMCWFEHGITASAGDPKVAAGMGLLPGSLCVHYARDPHRRTAYLKAIRDGLAPGFALDDGAGLLFEGRRAVEAFASRPDARVIRVLAGGVEVPLRPIALQHRLAWKRDPAVDELRELRRAREQLRGVRARAFAR
ncbi:MAG TPA: peptidase E [Solirubrobacterales bacterium]